MIIIDFSSKNQGFWRFFESGGRSLPLYLLSRRRNIVSDTINTFFIFSENIMAIFPRNFHESDIAEQHQQIAVNESIPIRFPIIIADAGFGSNFHQNMKNSVENFSIRKF